jgi:transketolase
MSAMSGNSEIAARIRRRILLMAATPEGCHLGGSMSVVDTLVALYARVLKQGADGSPTSGDCCILSKGHAAAALYGILVERGLLEEHELPGYGQRGSRLAGHPLRGLPGVGFPTGSLGHGLSLGLGTALAKRMDGDPGRVFVVLGDGELQEGAVWEAVMTAARFGVDRLVAIVDHNKLQINGRVLTTGLAERWSAFGWAARDVDGHDIDVMAATLDGLPASAGKPSVVIAHTVKGKGVPAFENRVKGHYVKLSRAEAAELAS